MCRGSRVNGWRSTHLQLINSRPPDSIAGVQAALWSRPAPWTGKRHLQRSKPASFPKTPGAQNLLPLTALANRRPMRGLIEMEKWSMRSAYNAKVWSRDDNAGHAKPPPASHLLRCVATKLGHRQLFGTRRETDEKHVGVGSAVYLLSLIDIYSLGNFQGKSRSILDHKSSVDRLKHHIAATPFVSLAIKPQTDLAGCRISPHHLGFVKHSAIGI